jgi:hypothetical protein
MIAPSPAVDRLLRRLDRPVPAAALLAVGGLILFACWGLQTWLTARARLAEADAEAVGVARDDLDQELSERQALRDLVARDLAGAKRNAASLSRSQRVLFEGGLAVSEEKRLLEKQWEIMTTYLLIDLSGDRVQVMRGEQALETRPLSGAVPLAVGGEKKAMPKLATIVSKERFAHVERAKSDVTDGRLDWDPPQVGTSARARALGENVLFTREGLVIHGPPLDKAEHEAFPHLCLSLPAATARLLYDRSFIGTRVMIKE